jgi:hypothetical protein
MYRGHFCRIELPPDLTESEAKERANFIAECLPQGTSDEFRCDLMRWDLRGKVIDLG